jgi:hypothetical protein
MKPITTRDARGPHALGPRGVPDPQTGFPTATTELIWLVYELLDAHDDTAALIATDGPSELAWAFHLDYLRALQRTGRQIVARASSGGGPA